jgi:hypothetical protein
MKVLASEEILGPACESVGFRRNSRPCMWKRGPQKIILGPVCRIVDLRKNSMPCM